MGYYEGAPGSTAPWTMPHLATLTLNCAYSPLLMSAERTAALLARPGCVGCGLAFKFDDSWQWRLRGRCVRSRTLPQQAERH